MKKIITAAVIYWQILLCGQNEVILNSYINGDQRDPEIISDKNGHLIVVWTSENQVNPDSDGDIFMQSLDAGLNKTGSEILVNEITQGNQIYPSAAMNSKGDFVITWASFTDFNSLYDIKAKVFKGGSAVTGEFLVNTHYDNSQTKPCVDIYEDGSFIIVWESWFEDGSDRGIFGQRFSDDGTKIGDQFQINTHTDYSQARPAVKYFPDGKFLAVWESWKQDIPSEPGYGVFGRVFNPGGEPAGDEIQINQYSKDYQWYADVAAIDSVHFAAVWCSWEQDGSDGGIYIRVFSTLSGALTGEIPVNSTARYFQWLPRLATTPDENLVVTWSSWLQDGSREGIYTKIYDRNLNEKSFEERLNVTTESFQWEPCITATGEDEIIAVWSGYDVLNKNYEITAIKKKLLIKEAVIDKSGCQHVSGLSTTSYRVNVIDSTQLTGDTYEITFAEDLSDQIYATVKNKTTGAILITDFYVSQGEDLFYITPVFDGVNVEIKPVLKLDLDFNESRFLNNSGSNISFNYVKPSGTTVIAPIDLVLVWGDPSRNDEGTYLFPLDSAYNSAGKIEIKVPFKVLNLSSQDRLDSYIIEPTATKNKQWDPGESIVILTPAEYQITFPNFHVQLNNSAPPENVIYPVAGDSIFIFTRRPLSTDDIFTFSTASQFVTSNDDGEDILDQFLLEQNYPNPFNPSTKISWQSPVGGRQTLKVFDVLGREVATLVDEYREAGRYEVEFQSTVSSRQLASRQGSALTSGVYFYRLSVSGGFGEFNQVKKMILLK